MSLPTYILPQPVAPAKLSLAQFIQTVIVGVSGIAGTLVRPRWQAEEPKQPDLDVDWLAFGIERTKADTYAYLWAPSGGQSLTSDLQRMEVVNVILSIYGPNCLDTYGVIRDGFQVPQNLFALRDQNMGFIEIAEARRLPDLVNGRWIDRIETGFSLVREIQRVYAVPTLLTASGQILTDLFPDGDQYLLDWNVEN